jgi:hypothetical protein
VARKNKPTTKPIGPDVGPFGHGSALENGSHSLQVTAQPQWKGNNHLPCCSFRVTSPALWFARSSAAATNTAARLQLHLVVQHLNLGAVTGTQSGPRGVGTLGVSGLAVGAHLPDYCEAVRAVSSLILDGPKVGAAADQPCRSCPTRSPEGCALAQSLTRLVLPSEYICPTFITSLLCQIRNILGRSSQLTEGNAF